MKMLNASPSGPHRRVDRLTTRAVMKSRRCQEKVRSPASVQTRSIRALLTITEENAAQ